MGSMMSRESTDMSRKRPLMAAAPAAPAAPDSLPPAQKRRRVGATDLSDRAIQLCTQDAVLAIHRRALRLGIVDEDTPVHSLLAGAELATNSRCSADEPATRATLVPFLPISAAAAGVAASLRSLVGGAENVSCRLPQEHLVSSGAGPSTSTEAVPSSSAILDSSTQRALYRMLHPSITAMLHEAALRRHSAAQACSFSDVLRVSELAQRIFILMPLPSRGPFACACRETAEVARMCWSTSEFEQVRPSMFRPLRSLGSPIAQLTAWVRSTQSKPVFFLLILAEGGRLEQLRIGFRRGEQGDALDTPPSPNVEQTKDWRLEEAVPPAGIGGPCVNSQFVVTKHHAYCVAAVQGQALLVKLGGQTSGTHEAPYRNRFPERVTAMAMCPLDNNIIAFGVPSPRASSPSQLDNGEAGVPSIAPDSGDPLGGTHVTGSISADAAIAGAASQMPTAGTSVENVGAMGGSDGSLATAPSTPSTDAPGKPTCRIELINFAASSRLQSIPTAHASALLHLDYSPDSARLLSCSADAVQLWETAAMHARPKPLETLVLPESSRLRLSRVSPDWTALLIGTDEALELRDLRRPNDVRRRSSDGGSAGSLLSLRWRRDNMQVTAAAFISRGRMLCVSDRGDRLLIFSVDGPTPVKACSLPWHSWGRGVSSLTEPLHDADSTHGDGASTSLDSIPIIERSGSAKHGRLCVVTAITECPEVRVGDGRGGSPSFPAISAPDTCTHLAVSSSQGDVALIKIP